MLPIAAIQPFSLSDFPNYPSAILFTIGCNFRCPYCFNKNLWDSNTSRLSEKIIFDFLYAKINKLEGVVITGGEPTLHEDKLINFIKKLKKLNYKIKLNTNGSTINCLKVLLAEKLVDYIAMDIKAPFSLYPQLSGGFMSTDIIQKSIDLIINSNISHEFRTVLAEPLIAQDMDIIKAMLPTSSKFITQMPVIR